MSNIIETIARKIDALITCQEKDNVEWEENHRETIRDIEGNYLPRGSGIDMGISVDMEESTPDRIILEIPFHHMNENGFYVGWTTYRAEIIPSFLYGMEINLSVVDNDSETSEYDRESTMEYLADILHDTLSRQWEGSS